MFAKKTIIIFGAVLVSLMMVSSVTAVQKTNSEQVMDFIGENNKNKNDIEDLENLLSDDIEIPDNQKIANLKYVINNFLKNKGIKDNSNGIYNPDDFAWENNEQKTKFIELKNLIKDEVNILKEEFKNKHADYGIDYKSGDVNDYKDYPPEFISEVSNIIEERFRKYFSEGGSEYNRYNDLKTSFEEAGFYEELNDYLKNAFPNSDITSTGSNSLAEEILIQFCVAYFIVWFFCVGKLVPNINDWNFPLLKILLVIPAAVSLMLGVLGNNILAAGVAFVAAFETILSAYLDSFMGALEYGLLGLTVWIFAAYASVSSGFVIVAFILIWLKEYLERADFTIGDILLLLPEYIKDIIRAAWDRLGIPSYSQLSVDGENLITTLTKVGNAWEDIWPIPEPNPKSKAKVIDGINLQIFERFSLFKKLFRNGFRIFDMEMNLVNMG